MIRNRVNVGRAWYISALLDLADLSVHERISSTAFQSGGIDSIQVSNISDYLCYKRNQIPFGTPISIRLHFILNFSCFNDYIFIFISLYHCLPPKCKTSL